MVEAAFQPAQGSTTAASTTFERRLAGEWALLGELVRRNPDRLAGLYAEDTTFYLTLSGTPARSLSGPDVILTPTLTEHRLRLAYPRFFPSLPIELYLDEPVFHPNIHPETGFVCLWDRHRFTNTAEHALHKLAAILGWRLANHEPLHVMQPAAAALPPAEAAALADRLYTPVLLGVEHRAEEVSLRSAQTRRPRLS